MLLSYAFTARVSRLVVLAVCRAAPPRRMTSSSSSSPHRPLPPLAPPPKRLATMTLPAPAETETDADADAEADASVESTDLAAYAPSSASSAMQPAHAVTELVQAGMPVGEIPAPLEEKLLGMHTNAHTLQHWAALGGNWRLSEMRSILAIYRYEISGNKSFVSYHKSTSDIRAEFISDVTASSQINVENRVAPHLIHSFLDSISDHPTPSHRHLHQSFSRDAHRTRTDGRGNAVVGQGPDLAGVRRGGQQARVGHQSKVRRALADRLPSQQFSASNEFFH
jgi:hypothetical protein